MFFCFCRFGRQDRFRRSTGNISATFTSLLNALIHSEVRLLIDGRSPAHGIWK